jgi:hypothetical protein
MIHDGAVTNGKKILAWMLMVAGGVAVAVLGGFLAAAGLDDADKWASVIGLFVALAGLGLSGYGLMLARRCLLGGSRPTSARGRPSRTPSSVVG